GRSMEVKGPAQRPQAFGSAFQGLRRGSPPPHSRQERNSNPEGTLQLQRQDGTLIEATPKPSSPRQRNRQQILRVEFFQNFLKTRSRLGRQRGQEAGFTAEFQTMPQRHQAAREFKNAGGTLKTRFGL